MKERTMKNHSGGAKVVVKVGSQFHHLQLVMWISCGKVMTKVVVVILFKNKIDLF